MKQLDLTKIPEHQLYLGWLSIIVKQIKPKEILISKEQSKGIFSFGTYEDFKVSPELTWKSYQGIPMKVKK